MLQNIPKEKIIDIVKQGPTFPAKIAKQLGGGGDTMLIGAILSTLISSGDIKVSTLKVGGSPLYYIPDQESKLEDFLSYMNEKDKNAFRLLKEKKVLQDSFQEPLTRVSLRTIKDFAKQFEIDHQGKKILFWRFYSILPEDAQSLAKAAVRIVVAEKPAPVEETVVQEQKPEVSEHTEHKASLMIEPRIVEAKPVVEKHAERPAEKSVEKHEVVQQVLEEKADSDKTVEPARHEPHEHKVHEKHEHHEKAEKPEHHETSEHHEKHPQPKVHHTDKPAKEPKEPKAPKAPKAEYNFYELILNHILSKKLDLISKEKIKKTEYDIVLKNHSNNEYIYCKAKDKSTISEGDLAPALIFAQNKKMPCLFLSTGELTKKAELLITKEFSGLTFERIIIEVKQA